MSATRRGLAGRPSQDRLDQTSPPATQRLRSTLSHPPSGAGHIKIVRRLETYFLLAFVASVREIGKLESPALRHIYTHKRPCFVDKPALGTSFRWESSPIHTPTWLIRSSFSTSVSLVHSIAHQLLQVPRSQHSRTLWVFHLGQSFRDGRDGSLCFPAALAFATGFEQLLRNGTMNLGDLVITEK